MIPSSINMKNCVWYTIFDELWLQTYKKTKQQPTNIHKSDHCLYYNDPSFVCLFVGCLFVTKTQPKWCTKAQFFIEESMFWNSLTCRIKQFSGQSAHFLIIVHHIITQFFLSKLPLKSPAWKMKQFPDQSVQWLFSVWLQWNMGANISRFYLRLDHNFCYI